MQQQVIKYLREAKGYISGEEISRHLKMSRAAIWKHMHQLRELGYDIEAIPHLGYRLASSPDKLIVSEIQHGLNTQLMGKTIYAFESVASTMDEAFRLSLEGAPHGALVAAETQTKGRGRLGRTWISPKGKGLYFSLILRPKLSLSQMPQLTLMTAVALREAIETATGVEAGIKWPNDLLNDGKKVAGILTELRAEADQMQFVVIGCGINVNATQSQLIDGATSLRLVKEEPVERIKLLQDILMSFEKWYGHVAKGEFSKVLSIWRKYSVTLNKRVRINDGAGLVEGIAIDIDKDGALIIKQQNGSLIKKFAGDVEAL